MSRRERRLHTSSKNKSKLQHIHTTPIIKEKEQITDRKQYSKIIQFYDKNYTKLLIIPILLLLISFAVIGVQVAQTGDFIHRAVSLKGGTTITIPIIQLVNTDNLETVLITEFPSADITVRALSKAGQQTGIIIDTDILEADQINLMLDSVEDKIGELGDYNTEQMGSSLGASFFKETLMSLYLAFLFMGLVVFLYFGNNLKYKLIASTLTGLAAIFLLFTSSTPLHIIAYLIGVASLIIYLMNSIPSIAVIGAALSDIIVTLAVVNIMGMKLSTAGIAAFLMLIGYSVDTDILLTTRLVKRKVGTVLERLLGAMKTGLTMSATTIAVVSLALIFSQSDTIRQIMTILLIGLIVDLINTWIQNVGILRIYLAKKTKSS